MSFLNQYALGKRKHAILIRLLLAVEDDTIAFLVFNITSFLRREMGQLFLFHVVDTLLMSYDPIGKNIHLGSFLHL